MQWLPLIIIDVIFAESVRRRPKQTFTVLAAVVGMMLLGMLVQAVIPHS